MSSIFFKTVLVFFMLNCCFNYANSQVFLNPDVDSIIVRDNNKIAADIYLPAGNGPFSTILIQTPYNRLFYRAGLPLGIEKNLSELRYAIVITDWRCFYGSSDACIPLTNNTIRGEDGYDIIEWITQQNWSNGKVGTWGASALAKVQFMTAREKHPAHICAVPLVSGSQFQYDEYFPGGAARTEYIEQLSGIGFDFSTTLMNNPHYNNVWQFVENNNMFPDEIEIPMLHIAGWYDHNLKLMINLFDTLQKVSPAAADQHILIGPWAHGGFGQTQVGSIQQGEMMYPEAEKFNDSLAIAFFDYHLENISNGWETKSPVIYYQVGSNTWVNANQWPPDGNTSLKFYLNENNLLTLSEPAQNNLNYSFEYNPEDPSPTIGGATLKQVLLQGPYDQAPVEQRNDNLVFTSEVLESDLHTTGSVVVKLHVESDKKDTDFIVRLTNVYPDGRSILKNEQILRMRFRDGYTVNDTSFLEAGVIYPIEIELPPQAITFNAGNRVRLIISSSNYPRYNRNMNNGAANMYPGNSFDAVFNPEIATNTVFANTNNLSFIEFQTPQFNFTEKIAESKAELTIYPVPANDVLTIEQTNELLFENPEIVIFDIYGRAISSQKHYRNHSTHIQLNVENLAEGFYILSVNDKGRTINKKILIQR
ncbi:MAG: CocE/NonD family hydrolase [Chitinophagaceae bacterium]|nr:MAG: CocE/NonD family hydrolase [Chitinophagaceae bacterium]